jgi:hypothetical protein
VQRNLGSKLQILSRNDDSGNCYGDFRVLPETLAIQTWLVNAEVRDNWEQLKRLVSMYI